MKLLKNRYLPWLFILTLVTSCNDANNPSDVNNQNNQQVLMVPSEVWSLEICTLPAGVQNCNRQYYVTFEISNGKDPSGKNPSWYRSRKFTPIVMASGQIALGNDIDTDNFCGEAEVYVPDVKLCWREDIDSYATVCTGTANGAEMSGECSERDYRIGTWRAEKGIVDVENGWFEKDKATGKTRLYFRAWVENASRVFITADFIDGQMDLVKCDESKLYWMGTVSHIIDIWKISSAPTCSTEGYYEFPSTTSPLVVKTHIVKEAGEIVREKTITEGVELNTGATGTN